MIKMRNNKDNQKNCAKDGRVKQNLDGKRRDEIEIAVAVGEPARREHAKETSSVISN